VSIESLRLPADGRFWPQAARAVIGFAADCGLPQRRIESLTWLVPVGVQAALARAALRNEIGAAFLPPRISPLASWLGRPLQSGIAARAELFAALRDSRWVRESFGDQPAALWSLAAAVAQLSDELTWAALDDADAFSGRLQASLNRHFHRRGARAMQPQAQLVMQLWHVRRAAGDGATAALRELQARAHNAAAPLVWTAMSEPSGWERAFLSHFAERAPVLVLVADVATVVSARPLLAAAWPELSDADCEQPIAARADAARGAEPLPLVLLAASSLEEEAAAVAQQVLDWRLEGVDSIALVALDRLSARRARALLERARVLVRDETGWKLSTTSAAAAVMRWYDLIGDDLYWRDLLDWLKSGFTLVERPGKAQVIDAFERAIRAGGAIQGARAIRGALAELAARAGDDDVLRAALADAGDVLSLIVEQQRAIQRAGPTLAAHLRALRGALAALGMVAGLAADPVGRALLREVEGLEADLAGSTARGTLPEFRALLAARLEEASFVDLQVDSPVVMVSLAAAALRPFDAALLIGVDARRLPALPADALFMPDAVRVELGLSGTAAALREQGEHLAMLLATVPRLAATWRRQQGDKPNVLSPLLQRLEVVAKRATGCDLEWPIAAATQPVTPAPSQRPAPSAAVLWPDRISASEAQALVDCPYRFYGRRLLRLAEPDDVIELPDKRDFGEALHKVLQRFHAEWGEAAFEALDPAALAQSLRRHAEQVFAPLTERAPAMLAFARRFDGMVAGYLDWLQQHAAEGWRWTAGESRREAPLSLPGGREVVLHGRLDRIDRDVAGREQVIDYKARPADVLARSLKLPGEDVQLPFYGLLLGSADSASYLSFDRARDEDSGVNAVAPPQPFGDLAREVGARLAADLQRVADGAPLPAIGAATVCDYCELRGLCRRGYWDETVAGEVGARPA